MRLLVFCLRIVCLCYYTIFLWMIFRRNVRTLMIGMSSPRPCRQRWCSPPPPTSCISGTCLWASRNSSSTISSSTMAAWQNARWSWERGVRSAREGLFASSRWSRLRGSSRTWTVTSPMASTHRSPSSTLFKGAPRRGCAKRRKQFLILCCCYAFFLKESFVFVIILFSFAWSPGGMFELWWLGHAAVEESGRGCGSWAFWRWSGIIY